MDMGWLLMKNTYEVGFILFTPQSANMLPFKGIFLGSSFFRRCRKCFALSIIFRRIEETACLKIHEEWLGDLYNGVFD